MADALSPTMTLRDFENGYWYLEQLKNFAERIAKDFIVEQVHLMAPDASGCYLENARFMRAPFT